MQYKEFTESHSKDLIEQISSIMETHMIGRTVIVKGKKGRVIKQVGSDGKTESDEIYQVKFEDGTVADIPARDMEMQGDDNKKIGENEAEELVKEAKKVRVKTQSGTTERVSPDDLKAAGDVFDRIKRLKLAIADKQHAAYQKKADNK